MNYFTNRIPDMQGVCSCGLKKRTNRLYQTSTMSALLGAVYDGEKSMSQLLEHGDFGIGTFDALDGEMIIVDGVVRHFRAEGHVEEVASDCKTKKRALKQRP